jgi:hypothetical protein
MAVKIRPVRRKNFSTCAKEIRISFDRSSETGCFVQTELLRSKPARRNARRVFALGRSDRNGRPVDRVHNDKPVLIIDDNIALTQVSANPKGCIMGLLNDLQDDWIALIGMGAKNRDPIAGGAFHAATNLQSGLPLQQAQYLPMSLAGPRLHGLRKGIYYHICAGDLGRSETLGGPYCHDTEGAMPDFDPNVLDQLMPVWGKAMQEKRYHDALAVAYAHYLLARATKLEDDELFLSGIKAAVDGLLPADDPANRTECSFCGRAPPDVRLAAGPRVFICNECVTMLSEEVFAAPA